MATYGGVTFNVLTDSKDGSIFIPILVPQDWGVVRTRIPYANLEQIQYTGQGNPRFTLHLYISTVADFYNLLATVGDGTPRTLGNPFGLGSDIINMLLQELRNVERVSFNYAGSEVEIRCDAVFEQLVGGL